MATNFKLKRSSVASKRPGLSNLELGELALNTYDGFLFTERNGLGITTVTNLTPWYENYGAGSIFYINKVGIGTTAVPDTNQLLIKGGTETDNINVTGITTVGSLTSGRVVTVGTGGKLQDSSNLTFDGTNLFVSGINITGGSTVGADIVTRNLKVTGISTHIGISTFNDAEFYDDVTFFGTNPSVSANKIIFDKSNNQMRFFDSTKVDFGQSGDLRIYHESQVSYIDCTNSNPLHIQSNDLRIRKQDGGEEMITAAANGTVKLYYDGSQKLTTLIDGISVTGTTDTDNFINAGVSTFVGIITASQTQNVIPFYYANVSDFPSSSAYHGAFAHAHNTGKAYFAHAGWKEIVSKEADGTIGVGTEQVRVGVTTVTDFNATGNVTLGDADTDNIVLNGEINSNIIPNTNIAYDLGSTTKRWGTLFTGATTKIDSDIVTRNLSVTGLGTFANDVTFTGASYNAVWDQSDNALEFADNAKATFGDGADLTLRHTGSASYLENSTGFLFIHGNDIALRSQAQENYIVCDANARVDVYYDNTRRLSTSGAGVTVYNQLDTTNINASGIITAVDGNFTGNVSIAGTLTYQDVTNVDSVGIATARVGLKVLSGGIDAVGVVTATGGLDAIGIQSGGVNITTGIITAINFTGTGNTVTYDSSTKIVSVSVGGAGGSGTGGKFVENNTGIHTLSNVGIGTTNASDKLKVLGDVAFTGALKVSPLGLSGSSGNYLKSVGTGVTWAAFPTARTVGLQTATANQTSFSFTYNVGFLDVYINGVKLTTNEFTATNGTSVVLTEGAFVGDQVQFISFNTTASGSGGGGGISNIVEDATPQLGGNLDLNSKIINGTGNIDYTGNFKASGIATATTFVGNLTGNVTGTATEATNVTVSANNTTNETVYPVFVDGATGTQGAETDTGLTYNPNTGNLTATKFSGDGSSITGISTSNITNYGVGLGGGGGSIAGISTTGTSVFNTLDIGGDIDVDGHTNLDNVSVAGVTTFASGNVQLASDSQRLQLGSGQDLWMYHTGTSGGGHGLIQNDYGTMYMLSDNFTFRDRSTNHDVFVISQNNSVSLFYQNSAKLSTTNTGVSVSGTLAATAVTGDGSNLTGIAVTEAPVTDYTITANGNSAYRFAGGGVNSSTDNPDLYLVRGQKYRFNNTTGTGHPFEFRDSANGADYTSGISGSQSGIQFFTVPLDAPALLKYRCTIHTVNMVGNIYIRGAGGHETNVGVTTITGASGNLLNVNHTGGSGAQGVIRTKASQANSSSFIRAEDSGTTYIGLLKYGTGHSAYGALGAGDGALYANSGGGNDANITVMADSATGYINFATGGNSEKVRFTAAGNVGIGTVDPAASNITTALSTNTKSLAVGIVTCNQLFVSGIKVTSGGHYADIAAATADGMSHYFPGSSTTSLISNLSPDSGATLGSPSANNTAGSYFNNYPYFDFYSGNSSENGYRYTQTTAKWANGPFTIAFWAKPMSSTLESESTFVQLGDHPSGVLRCLYTVSTDASRQIKTITIGDDSSALNTAVLTTDWNHWVTTYDGSVTRYYLNGSLARSHTHSGNLDVGTGNKYFWIGFGYWNTSTTNKASMSHMSDIGIWNAKALSAATISSIYNAKRTVVGY